MTSAAETTAAVSVRNMRGPRVTHRPPAAVISPISSAVMPPSGPTTMPMSRASGFSVNMSFSRVPSAASQGISSRSWAAIASRALRQSIGAATRRGMPRPHCLAASRAIFSSRSRRFSPSLPSSFATQRAIRTAASAAAPSSVSFWAMKSSLSAFGRPSYTVRRTGASLSGNCSSRFTRTLPPSMPPISPRQRRPAPSMAQTASPGRRRSTFSACLASSGGSMAAPSMGESM